MRLLICIVLFFALGMVGCSEPVTTTPGVNEIQIPKSMVLNMRIDSLRITHTGLISSNHKTLVGANDQPIGQSMQFMADSCIYNICYDNKSGIVQFGGKIGAKTFIIKDSIMNMCGGVQGVKTHYTLTFL